MKSKRQIMIWLLCLHLPWLLVAAAFGHEGQPAASQLREHKISPRSIESDSDIPIYYSFMESLKGSETLTNCKGGGFSCVKFPEEIMNYLEGVGQTDANKIGTFLTTPAVDSTLKTYTGPTKNNLNSKKLSAYVLKFNDPAWWKQWHMQDYRTTNIPVMDHNVVPVLNMGIKGNKITVAILGDGMTNHPDLGNRFVEGLSYDFCQNKKKQIPAKKSTESGNLYESEGNYNAGLIAMQAGNGICGVGVAPNANIAAFKIRQCESPSGENPIEAKVFIHQISSIDIYCNQWTSTDVKGEALIEMDEDVKTSIIDGIMKGRSEQGAIYVFPSGRNRANNNCATNGYVNFPYTITIASANQAGKPASYSERCSAVFATAYSGDKGMDGLVTIDANNQCASYFTDTPAGPAIASGIIALLLEANTGLTYRDVMHIIAMTAEVAPLADNENTWYRNGAGFWVSNDFGFGLLNAENMIKLAKDWRPVPTTNVCFLKKKFETPMSFDVKESKTITIGSGECDHRVLGIMYLEHLEVQVSAQYPCRGAIDITLTSPAGTVTKVLEPRLNDKSDLGFKKWNIMTIQNWGENPKGDWKVTIKASDTCNEGNPQGQIMEVAMKLHGTRVKPVEYPRQYAAFRLPDGKTNKKY